jgi:drug/metabolite transporter (DMT)-like permease
MAAVSPPSLAAPDLPAPALPGDATAQRRGLALVALAALIWSTGGLIVRSLEVADVWTTVFWRSAFAALFLVAYIAWRERGRTFAAFRDMGRPGLVVALCFAGASICLVVALNLTTVANTLVIFSTAPLFAALFGRLWLGEPVRRQSWLAMLGAVCGVAIMVSDSFSRGSLAGDLFALGTAIGLAVATVTIRARRELRMTPATCLGTILAALVALPLATPLAVTGGDFGLLFVFGAGQLGLGLALFASGARLAPAAEVALVAVLEPVLGPLWVWALLGEHPGGAGLLGGGLVLGALVLHSALDLRRGRAVAPSPV